MPERFRTPRRRTLRHLRRRSGRAGTNPVIILTPRVSPSMASTVIKWSGRRSDHKTTAHLRNQGNWQADGRAKTFGRRVLVSPPAVPGWRTRFAAPLLSPGRRAFAQRASTLAELDLRLAASTIARTKDAQRMRAQVPRCDFSRLIDTHPAMPARAEVNQYTPLSREMSR